MVRVISKGLICCVLLVFANANDSLMNEMLGGEKGYGCNDKKTECWNVDWLGEEKFFLSSVGIKAIGKGDLREDACERVIKHYLPDEQESFRAKNLLIDSIHKENNELQAQFKVFEFKVNSYQKTKDDGKEPENITSCELRRYVNTDLINHLQEEKFECLLQPNETTVCQNNINSTMVEFYFRGNDVNVVVEKKLKATSKYDAYDIFNDQKTYCHYAFDNMLGSESKRAKELLDFNIKREHGSEVIYSSMMYEPSSNIKKTVSVLVVDEQKDDFRTIGMICFISPLISLYLQ